MHNVPGTTERLGDFTATPRMVTIGLLAIGIGVVSAYVARALLLLISFFTNLFFFQRISTASVSPADNTLGLAQKARDCPPPTSRCASSCNGWRTRA